MRSNSFGMDCFSSFLNASEIELIFVRVGEKVYLLKSIKMLMLFKSILLVTRSVRSAVLYLSEKVWQIRDRVESYLPLVIHCSSLTDLCICFIMSAAFQLAAFLTNPR